MTAIGTYLLLMLQGKLFAGIVEIAVDHEHVCFFPRNHDCFSYPSYNSEFCNKATTNKNYSTKVKRFLLALTLLHQKEDVCYEVTSGKQM